jgi:hypothetical protein
MVREYRDDPKIEVVEAIRAWLNAKGLSVSASAGDS